MQKVATGRKLRERLLNFLETKLLLSGWPILSKWRKQLLAKVEDLSFSLLRAQYKLTFKNQATYCPFFYHTWKGIQSSTHKALFYAIEGNLQIIFFDITQPWIEQESIELKLLVVSANYLVRNTTIKLDLKTPLPLPGSFDHFVTSLLNLFIFFFRMKNESCLAELFHMSVMTAYPHK